MTKILGIKLDNRLETAVRFQKTITGFGCEIKTRIGLHDTEGCADFGIIILIISEKSAENIISALSKFCLVKEISF